LRYRRSDTKGASYFFTVNLNNRKTRLLLEYIDALRASFSIVKQRHPFTIDAIVILPDHLHAVLTLPHTDNNYAKRWMLIKSAFTRSIPKGEAISPSRASKRERGLWQRRYWEHLIRDERDFETHVNYIHYNPVKHGHAQTPVDWPYSSIHQYIKRGELAKNWGGDYKGSQKNRGESE
jgi:putative transposase